MSPYPKKAPASRSTPPKPQARTYIPLSITEAALRSIPRAHQQRVDSQNPPTHRSQRGRRLSWTHFQNRIGAFPRPTSSPRPQPSLDDVERQAGADSARQSPSALSLDAYVLSGPAVKRLARPPRSPAFADSSSSSSSSRGRRRSKRLSLTYSEPRQEDDNEQVTFNQNLLVCFLAILFVFFAVT